MSEYTDYNDENDVKEEPEEETVNETAEAETGPENGGADAKTAEAEETSSKKDETDKPDNKKIVKVPLFAAIIAALAIAVLTAQITFLSVRQSYHRKLATIEKNRFADSKLEQIDELYRKYYINDIDDSALVDGLAKGYILGAGDKYGGYMSREEYEQFENKLDSKFDGIGVNVTWDSGSSCLEVIEVYEGSPAEAAGLLPADLITEVAKAAVSELGMDEAVDRIRGETGTKVNLTVVRGGSTLSVDVERGKVDIKTVKLEEYGTVAVIKISNFYSSTAADFKAAVSRAKEDGCDRIVYDLRGNTGGLLDSVTEVLDHILPAGKTVRMVDAAGNWTYRESDESCLQMPMVIIVNGETASAAELFTAALRDFDYATVVGTQTYGKGTVVSTYTLSDGSSINVSTNRYYPPVSDNFEGKGITPDVILDQDEETKKLKPYEINFENDIQLQKAVEIIKEK